ncbi:hypothetical protein NPIL_639941 [Nephila pilipes]|uniref:Uncharacterized protein n=1 Tax=Nephila pilipes TaxID=299642 RepID=A0A8X6NNL2_NEPPI|nr:hypothetical protein NPIL_639941 [Nephila pilipes]
MSQSGNTTPNTISPPVRSYMRYWTVNLCFVEDEEEVEYGKKSDLKENIFSRTAPRKHERAPKKTKLIPYLNKKNGIRFLVQKQHKKQMYQYK